MEADLGALRLPAPLDAQLAPALDAEATGCGASGWALVEVDLRDGVLAHRVRLSGGTLGAGGAGDTTAPAALEGALRAAAPDGYAGRRLPLAGGGGQLWVCALPVEPGRWQGPDCGLLLRDPARAPAPERLAHLGALLSADRQRALDRLAFLALRDTRDPVELVDREVRLLWANPAWERHTGWTLPETQGRFLSFLRDPSTTLHDPHLYRHTEQVIDEEGRWSGFIGSRSKDGRRLAQEVTVSRFGSAAEGVVGNVGIRRDLAGRAAREEALALSQLQLRALLLALPLPVIVAREGEVIFANTSAADLFGREQPELIGARLPSLVHPGDRHLLPGLRGGAALDLRVLRRGGQPVPCELAPAGAPIFDGAPAQVLLLRDRTALRVDQEQELLGERVAAARALAVSLRNELSSPLSVLLHHLGVLEAEAERLPGPLRAAAEEARGAARRIEGVNDSLRGISRLRRRGDGGAAEVDTVLDAALKLLAGELRHLGRVRVEGEAGLVARIGEAELLQVLVHLLENAAEALSPSAYAINEVRVVRGRAGEAVELRVEDNGPGLAPAQAAAAFDAFVTSKREHEGLGLTVCKALVEGAAGAITLGPAEGGGLSVRVLLPAVVAAPRAPAAGGPAARVLVVDDEPALGRSIQRMLREHAVEVCTSGPDALVRLSEDPLPDVILCDLMMPVLSGPALHEAISRLRPELEPRFLFMTGGVFTDEGRAFVQRMDGRVVDKPFTAGALRARIGALLSCARAPAP